MGIYLDFNASTPLDPEVIIAIRPYLKDGFGNPSSHHWASTGLATTLAQARIKVAQLINALPEEIVFTSGGSEATNHALKGAYFASGKKNAHIITTQIEHPATIETCRFLEKIGAEVTFLSVNKWGIVNPEEIRLAITDHTLIVSIMHANNEVGSIQPIAEISAITREHGVLMHTDAAQSIGKIRVSVESLGVDLLTLAGHKLYAPKGIGALYIRSGVEIEPLIHGGGQESGRRSGTESVLMAVALATACELAGKRLPLKSTAEIRDYFWRKLERSFGSLVIQNGSIDHRLPNTLNVSFIGQDSAKLLDALGGIAASTGSACHENQVAVSPVLAAMGLSNKAAMGAIRFSIGNGTTKSEINETVKSLTIALKNTARS